MDTPLPENRSNLLVNVAAGVSVVALILSIIAFVQISKIKKQLGDTDLVKLSSDVAAVDQKASAAASDARTANTQNNPAIKALTATMQREIGNELADIRSNLARVEELAKKPVERPVVSVASGGGSGGPTATPGSLDADGSYVIKSGDTYGKIAPQFGVTAADIVAANPGVDPRRLRVGQKIVIPKK